MKIQIATLLAVACTLSASGVAVADNTWAKYCAKGVTPPKDTAYACFAGRNPLFKKLSSSSRFNGRFSPDLRGKSDNIYAFVLLSASQSNDIFLSPLDQVSSYLRAPTPSTSLRSSSALSALPETVSPMTSRPTEVAVSRMAFFALEGTPFGCPICR